MEITENRNANDSQESSGFSFVQLPADDAKLFANFKSKET
jgi:hypothetical protein